MRRLAAAVAIVALAAAGYAAHRLWVKSSDELRPAYVARDADAGALLSPSLGARARVLFGRRSAAQTAHPRLIALTFDDGPYPVTTPLLVQTLHDLGVPATFFLIGRDAQQFPALTQAIAAAGNEIADHTLTHPDLTKLDAAAVTRELDGGTAALEAVAPDPAEHAQFRPPHGRYTLATVRAAQTAGYATVLWNDDPGDWRAVAPSVLEAHVLAHATAPEILLLHDGRVPTVAMLGDLVTRFRRAGYTFVTAGELLRRVTPAGLNDPAQTPLNRE